MRLCVCLFAGVVLWESPLLAFDKSAKVPLPAPVTSTVVSTPLPRFTPYYGYYQTQWRTYPSGAMPAESLLPTPLPVPTPSGRTTAQPVPTGKVIEGLPAVMPSTPSLPELPKVPKIVDPEMRGPQLILPRPQIVTIPLQEPTSVGPVLAMPKPSMLPPMFSPRRLILPPPTLPPDAGEVYPPLERPSPIKLPPIIPSASETPENLEGQPIGKPAEGQPIGKPAPLPLEILEPKAEQSATLGRPIEEKSSVKTVPSEEKLQAKPFGGEEKIVPAWPMIRKQ
ncbi:MAG: hypothetical protein N2112_04240 [Gemmataceae bacterium]|nr:hypothetical protein [Gemmataceae bacterium]